MGYKHAYLIMAHSNYNQLLKLLMCLDDVRNDIYLHLDIKFRLLDSQIQGIKDTVKKSTICLVERCSIAWGGVSQIQCEANLINIVANSSELYSYIHFISGLDLPIKNQDDIHNYFAAHQGEEFIEFMNNDWVTLSTRRLKYFYPLQECAGGLKSKSRKKLVYDIQRGLVKMQQLAGINRIKNFEQLVMGGSNWFSITFECAKYVASQIPYVLDIFKATRCADELFVQTIVGNSKYYENRHIPTVLDGNHENLRLIEWISGSHPKTFSINDIDHLLTSDLMFARKFDDNIDQNVIDVIVENVTR